MGNLMASTISESLCCNCCCSCGSTQLNMQANVSFLNCNSSFDIQGNLDASMSKTEINNYKIILRQKLRRVANKTRQDTHDQVLYDARKGLRIG